MGWEHLPARVQGWARGRDGPGACSAVWSHRARLPDGQMAHSESHANMSVLVLAALWQTPAGPLRGTLWRPGKDRKWDGPKKAAGQAKSRHTLAGPPLQTGHAGSSAHSAPRMPGPSARPPTTLCTDTDQVSGSCLFSQIRAGSKETRSRWARGAGGRRSWARGPVREVRQEPTLRPSGMRSREETQPCALTATAGLNVPGSRGQDPGPDEEGAGPRGPARRPWPAEQRAARGRGAYVSGSSRWHWAPSTPRNTWKRWLRSGRAWTRKREPRAPSGEGAP